ncbi:MAG: DUF1254 domain-containing protein [Alphaproteobacteria bacterium]|nr:DUF1254 domain-containing protein [Alphaproteobacteria bacterium]
MIRRRSFTALAPAALLAAGTARAQGDPAMLKDLAREAAIFVFPLVEMYRTRWNATVNPNNPRRLKLNTFIHVPRLADHTSRAVTTPNNDTMYSSGWLDLSGGPMFLTLPEMGERYYSFAFMDLFTNNFAYVCRRLHGATPRPHMVVGPSWTGTAPDDVTLVRSPTNSVWLLGRILVDGPEDVNAVRLLQSRVRLETPDVRNERRIHETREIMRQNTVVAPEPVADWPAIDRNDPFHVLDVGARAWGESPVRAEDAPMVERLAPLRLRPARRFDSRGLSDGERTAVLAGLAEATTAIRGAGVQFGRFVDGWGYSHRSLGNFGTEYLYRAHIALTGLAALEPVEATYMFAGTDADGRLLEGGARYTLRFEAGRLPPARAFWSLSMYEVTPEGRAFFVDNPIQRYAIGDRTRGLVRGPDGSLEIALQAERPAAGESNWLPTPASGPMRITMRLYEPEAAALDGRYTLPAVRRVG